MRKLRVKEFSLELVPFFFNSPPLPPSPFFLPSFAILVIPGVSPSAPLFQALAVAALLENSTKDRGGRPTAPSRSVLRVKRVKRRRAKSDDVRKYNRFGTTFARVNWKRRARKPMIRVFLRPRENLVALTQVKCKLPASGLAEEASLSRARARMRAQLARRLFLHGRPADRHSPRYLSVLSRPSPRATTTHVRRQLAQSSS